jgi:hypothetical protein
MCVSFQKANGAIIQRLSTVDQSLQDAATLPALDPSTTRRTRHIRARTARRWLKKLGFSYKDVRKEVVEYRNEVFLKAWQQASRRFVIFNRMVRGKTPLVFSQVRNLLFSLPMTSQHSMPMTERGVYGWKRANNLFGPKKKERVLWYLLFW